MAPTPPVTKAFMFSEKSVLGSVAKACFLRGSYVTVLWENAKYYKYLKRSVLGWNICVSPIEWDSCAVTGSVLRC